MRSLIYLLICFFFLPVRVLAADVLESPATAIKDASADIGTLPVDVQHRTRYLSLYNIVEKDRKGLIDVLNFHCNSLSREAYIVRVVPVGKSLIRINISDYGWNEKTWEKLADNEPFFHLKIETEEFEEKEFGHYEGAKFVVTRKAKEKTGKKTTVAAAAPWIAEGAEQQQAITLLIGKTLSQTPVVRGDWFLAHTAIQADRDGSGYYDFLGLGKKQADFDELVGFDQKLADRFKAELAGVVLRSTVSLNNRRLVRFGKIGGAKWISLDAKNNLDKRNFARVLDAGFEFDATEQIASLPNKLHVFWLANSKGERQDSAPDFIASDGSATGTDRRVHAGKSCITCHVEGIRPIDDWIRKLIKPPLSLNSPDYEQAKRLRQLYLSDLIEAVEEDSKQYARAILRCNGLTIAENAKAYARQWDRYLETDFDLGRIERELGVPQARIIEVFRKAPNLDPILAGLIQEPPLVIRAEQWEEAFSLAQIALKGIVP